MQKSLNNGFTLVELAIVMTIIGLLIGGVLKGQQLMENARITATIKQHNSQKAALVLFKDTYNYLPGDLPNARARLKNCTASNACYNGDGNNLVGVFITSWASDPYDDSPLTTENTQFWKHLAAADMISGVSPQASVPAWNETHPSAPFGGGFRVVDTNHLGIGGTNGSLISRLVTPITGPVRLARNQNPVNSDIAMRIDSKIDDGVAATGSVQASSASDGAGCRFPNGVDQFYNPTNTDNDCIIGFFIQ